MTTNIITVLTYTLIPVAATVVGGFVAAFRPPSPRLRSYAQHLAAGTVFAALAVELLPDVVHGRRPVAAVVGFALGTILLLVLRQTTEGKKSENKKSENKSGGRNDGANAVPGSLGLIAAVGVDIAVDGLVIGLAFATGAKQGLLITAALSLELLFLGIGVAASMSGASRGRIVGTMGALAVTLTIGAAAGALLGGRIGGAPLEALLAFGCAALLFLVAEELLVEAHEVPETPFTTATFFIGFLLVLILDMIG